MDYKIIESRSGLKSISIKNESGFDLYLHSRYNPEREAQHWVEKNTAAIKKRQPVFLIFGLGLGYHIRALHDKFPDAKIIVLEPLLPRLTETNKILAGIENLIVLYETRKENIADVLINFVPSWLLGEIVIFKTFSINRSLSENVSKTNIRYQVCFRRSRSKCQYESDVWQTVDKKYAAEFAQAARSLPSKNIGKYI